MNKYTKIHDISHVSFFIYFINKNIDLRLLI